MRWPISSIFSLVLASLVVTLGLAAGPAGAQTAAAKTASAKSTWHSASKLGGLRPLQPAEREKLAKQLANTDISYSLTDSAITWTYHPGNLRLDGNLSNDLALIVEGDLELSGSYNDNRGEGLLIVLGNMKVEHLLTWYGLHVQGAVEARGLLFGYYNDYSFFAGGGVTARGVVFSDHSSSYTLKRAEFELDDLSGFEEDAVARAITLLVPELLTDPNQLELDEYSDLTSLQPSWEVAEGLVLSGKPLFRATPADAKLVDWARKAIAADSSDADLLALIGRDALVDQLIAARPELSRAVANAVAQKGDASARPWLAGKITDLALLGGEAALTAGLAEQLVAQPDLADATLLAIARANAPEIRRTLLLAERELPDSVLALVAADRDPEVKATLLFHRDHAARLTPADQQRLVGDPSPEVRRALAAAFLPGALAAKLAQDSDREVRLNLARSLANQADHPFPALPAAEREQLAEKLFAGGDPEISATVFLALPLSRQLAIEKEGKVALPWDEIAERTRHPELMRALSRREAELEIQGKLAANLALPVDLQQMVLDRAQTSKIRCEDCWRYPDPLAVLNSLLENDNAAAATVLAAAKLALRQRDAEFVSTLTNRHDLPADVLALLDAEWRGGEEWSLTVVLQQRATRAMLERAIPRWYEEDEVTQAINSLRRLDDAAWWQAMARHPRKELREVAAGNLATPAALVVALLADPEPDVVARAAWNPALPQAAALDFVQKNPEFLPAMPALPLEHLTNAVRNAPTWLARQRALEAYQQRRWRAAP